MNFGDLIKELKRQLEKEPKGYDTEAEVVQIEDDIAWVQIPGGEDPTPVKLTIDAHVGDTVQVRLSGGSAFLVGNQTAPPTDDTTAKVAQTTADEATVKAEQAQIAAETAQKTADLVTKIAGNTEQHFWMTETGTDTGAHITEVTQEEFLADPTNAGGNLLARSNGIAIRKGLTEVAIFSENTIEIGKNSDESTIKMLNGTLQIKVEETDGVDFCEFIGGNNIEGFSFNKTTYLTDGLEVEEPASFYDSVTILGGNLAVSGNVQDIAGNKYTKQTNSTTWSSMTASGAIKTAGGFFKEGKHVYVSLQCNLNSAGSPGDNITLFTGLPEALFYIPLEVMVANQRNGVAWINDTGELHFRPSASVTTSNVIAINGHYVSA